MDRSVVYKATSNTGPPVIPEHVTREVLEICQADSARCLQIICFLKYRMTKYDPLIKLKCVKLCHRLLEKEPHGEIRKLIRRDLVDSLKILSHFSPGKVTEDRSIQIAREIRVEAETVLALIFDEYNEPSSHEITPDEPSDTAHWGSGAGTEVHEHRASEGLGAGDFETSGLSYSDRLRGIGSSDFSPSHQRRAKGKDFSFGEREREGSGIKSFVNMISSNITANLPESLANSLANMTAGLSSSFDRPPRSRNHDGNNCPAYQRRNTSVLQNTGIGMRGGPRWTGPEKRSDPQRWIGSALKASDQTTESEAAGYGGEYEQRLLDRICEPSGAKLTPSAADLEAFCRDCSGLDVDTIVVLLFAKMDAEEPNEATAWKRRLRCLYVLEALLKSPERIVNCQGAGRGETLGNAVLAITRSRKSYTACIQAVQRLNRCQRIAAEVYMLITGEACGEEALVAEAVVAKPRVNSLRVSLLDLSGDEAAEKNGNLIHQQEATAASSDVVSGNDDEEEEDFANTLLKRDSRSPIPGNLLDDFYCAESSPIEQATHQDAGKPIRPGLASMNLLDL